MDKSAESRWCPPHDELDRWLASAEGVGTTVSQARGDAEKNLRLFVSSHKGVTRDGEIWVAKKQQIGGQHFGRVRFYVVVHCHVCALAPHLRWENKNGNARPSRVAMSTRSQPSRIRTRRGPYHVG